MYVTGHPSVHRHNGFLLMTKVLVDRSLQIIIPKKDPWDRIKVEIDLGYYRGTYYKENCNSYIHV